ncbi:MAG: hypothetical protein IJ871_02215 [Ruminococcus sp.]|nr:hypothetical protein [Ruminococcus sp.]
MKILRRTTALMTALSLAAGYAGSLPYAVLSAEAYSKSDIVSAVHENDLRRHGIETNTSFRESSTMDILEYSNTNAVELTGVELPEKYDLRNVNGKNYVSPVKLQNPWGTCWSFGGTAAAETSLASSKDFDYNNPENEWLLSLYDLSEKHLAWFAFNPITEKSGRYLEQVGEGYYSGIAEGDSAEDICNKVYNHGGFYSSVNTLYSAGIGPAFETSFPYRTSEETANLVDIIIACKEITGDYSKDNTSADLLFREIVNQDDADAIIEEQLAKFPDYEFTTITDIQAIIANPSEDNIGKKYIFVYPKEVNDWTLDDSDRFTSEYYLKDGNALPAPYSVGENMEYIYNPNATAAIKNEIVQGRGVAIAFQADQSMPGETIDDEGFMNFLDEDGNVTDSKDDAAIWAQYTYDPEYDPNDPASVNMPFPANHAVCIIGYDDTFPKEYFKDPNGTIGGDGAWIIKNSWGTDWGSGGTGYFYLSYYDQSLCMPESIVLDTNKDTGFLLKNIDMYDFLPTQGRNRVTMEDEINMASVFTADNNCAVRFIGVETTSAESDVEYKVYKLNDGASSPVDGELFAQQTEHFATAGYHMVDIGRALSLRAGDKYSVVVNIKDQDGYELNVSRDVNERGIEYYEPYAHERFIDSGKDPDDYNPAIAYSHAVVNKGESFVGSGSEWTDWADVVTELKALNKDLNNDGFEYDNFAVRSYPETEYLSVSNKPVDEQESYKAGDVLKGVIKVKYNLDTVKTLEEMNAECEIELTINGKQFMIGEDNKDAVITKLALGETLEIPYEYTVTEEDAAKGSIESTARLIFMGVYIDEERPPIFPEDLTFTVLTGADKQPESSAADKQPESSAADSKAASTATTTNPGTGAAAGMAALTLAAAAAVTVKKKKN